MKEEEEKIYSPQEKKWNVRTHVCGAVIAAAALAVMPFSGFVSVTAGVGFAVYGLTLLFVYVGSSCYHAAEQRERRLLLRRVDHAAIYLLIAGTYTPLMLVGLPDWRGYSVLAGCWGLAAAGLALNFLRFGKYPKLVLTLNLVMGWLCLVVIMPLYRHIGKTAFLYLLWGGGR